MSRQLPSRERLLLPYVGDESPAVQRALQDVARVVNAIVDEPITRARLIRVELESGLNRVSHGLGRVPQGFVATPSSTSVAVADDAETTPHTRELLSVRTTGATTANLMVY